MKNQVGRPNDKELYVDSLLGTLKYTTQDKKVLQTALNKFCLLYTSPSPRDRQKSRMPSSA